uniref:Elongator complex protein 5 n=1 Tax=Steinernema glaseri TaxID=37863 RepID=A0A1I7ZT46_9BILA
MPSVSFNMGLKLKASEMAAKQKVHLPYMEAQKEEGLVGLNISQGKKIRVGGQIIYTPDEEDDLDDSDPDDDLMI